MTQVLGMNDPQRVDPKFHGWLCEEAMVPVSTLYLLPRDHTKSVTIAVLRTVQSVLENPNNSILIASRTVNRSEENLAEIRQHLANPLLTYLYPDILWDDPERASNRRETVWTNQKIKVKRDVIRSDTTVWIAGVGKTITGAHPDIIVLDDIINEENVATEDQIDKIWRWFEYLQPIASTQCELRIVGTIYDEFDLYNKLIELAEAEKIRLRVIKREVIEEGKFIYSFYNEERLKEKRAIMSERAFRAQYFNSIIVDEERAFRLNLIQDYDSLPQAINEYDSILTIDPSFSTTKGSDNIGFVVCLYDQSNNVWVEKAIRLKMSVVELLREIYKYHEIYRFQHIGIESGAWQNAIQDMFNYIIVHENLERIPITDIKLSKEINAKQNRIVGLTGYFEKQIIYLKSDVVDEDTNEVIERNTGDLRQEMYYFSATSRQKDDVLDALSMQKELHIWGDERRGDVKRFKKGITYRDLIFGTSGRGKGFGYY